MYKVFWEMPYSLIYCCIFLSGCLCYTPDLLHPQVRVMASHFPTHVTSVTVVRGPRGYSMCFENPQHPPSEKPMLPLDRTLLTGQRLGSPPYVCQCDRLTFWYTSFWVSRSPNSCLNACRCVCLAVCSGLCFGLCLCVAVSLPWSDRARVW